MVEKHADSKEQTAWSHGQQTCPEKRLPGEILKDEEPQAEWEV